MQDITFPTIIPVARPELPRAEAILPYLREIDASHVYTNGGALMLRFEQTLARHYGADLLLCHASGTAGLVAALLALRPMRGALCMMPAWSFAASAHAARMAGLTPWFVDVDRNGALTPDLALAALAMAPSPVAAVMAVMPFGAPVDAMGWEEFRERAGLPVVIDGAAAFDTLRPSSIPTVVSLHATKVFGVGEGGFTTCTDLAYMNVLRSVLNFGFDGGHSAGLPALNGKMSEYASAVGLAALPDWPEKRRAHMQVARFYRERLPQGIEVPTGFGDGWVSSALSVRLQEDSLVMAERALARRGIGTKRWWQTGLHRMPAFADCPRLHAPATDGFAATTLGLPFYPGLTRSQVHDICAILEEVLAGRHSSVVPQRT
ncbi:DegT/DnrJ/EryC1/StrS family aminotransferase [Thalassovita aquimarina]|uniref:DegT/DnrJ/EryC1/StrS aminotransferase family protein n=1 Tax=Thalassovita aquimarina TaxID=2785917 RepID=A0ABS5HWH0_9RHOB|nr:DegT/DnrJ/EryC1/StrS family aminotransferase [Thalassovita aquimarina]MBR9653350.1 DegT/DnrJ/EryC1/StrS aminotransferase family protein [Thalassovita aquimarina]